jgi:hypothetical protein
MTRTRTLSRLFIAIAATVAMAACADSSTGPTRYSAPAAGQPDASLLGSLLTPANVVTRTAPLAANITASAVVTPSGGGIVTIPAAGLTVVVPPGAVSSTMTITVTALAGNLVAYDFGPSGTKFSAPLQVTQSTSGTNISLLSVLLGNVHAAYFANDSQINFLNGTALVNDVLSLNLGALLGTVQFNVSHFSGYLLATGLSGDSDDGGGPQNDALRRVGSGGGSH